MSKKKNRSRRKQNHPKKATRPAARPVATSTSKYSEDTLVSVILVTETVNDDGIYTVIKNVIEEQTHKKIDLIVSSFREEDDCKEIMERASKLHLDIRWIFHKPENNFIDPLSALAEGEVVFYKTTNNCLWFPRHIQVHLENYNKDSGYGFSLSRIEQRNLDNPDSPYSTLSWRIANVPEVEQIIIDEISHIGHLETDWGQCLKDNNGQPAFFAGLVLKQWIGEKKLRGGIPDEISVIEWKSVNPEAAADGQGKNAEEFYDQVALPERTEPEEEIIESEEGLEIKYNFPTIMGSIHHNEYCDKIMDLVNSQDTIDSIALKRTMGMGDVVLVEPIIRKLREKYNAPITLYTAKPDIVEYFKNKPDKVEVIDEELVVKDALHDKPEQLKIDLDLSYESRLNCQFLDAYSRVAGVDFKSTEDKHPQLVCAEEKLITDKKYVVVGADGSGWPGKTWPIEKYAEVIDYVRSMGYEVYETGYEVTDRTDKSYHACELNKAVNLLAHCEFYIGADNGPMHIARSFNRPCVAINGAALTYLTNPNRDDIVYVEDPSNGGYGIKHRQFFNLTQQGLTFVPLFEEDPSSGLNNIEVSHVTDAISKLFSTHQDNKFSMNISGSISQKDKIPGFAYYKDEDGNYHRENPSYHPDQRINISMVYEDQKDDIWNNNFESIHNDIKTEWNGNPALPKILDVGCNMGIFVNGMNDKGFSEVVGYDINRMSIDRGKEVFEDVADKLVVKDISGTIDEEDKYDVVLMSDVISYVGSPNEVIKNINKVLKKEGTCYLNSVIIDSEKFTQDPRGYPPVGNGEHITLFTAAGLRKLLSDNGLIAEEYGEWQNSEEEMIFWKCRKG